jgi:hypothetical protein
MLERDPEQAPEDEHAESYAGYDADRATGDHRAAGGIARDRDTVEEEHRFRAFAQHRDRDHHEHHGHRARAAHHVLAHLLRVRRELAPVDGHPDVVPGEHRDGDAEDRGVEELLPHAFRELADLLRAKRDEDRTDQSRGEATDDVADAARDAGSRRRNDADDERGLEDFAEDDERGAEHIVYLATMTPLAVFSLNSPANLYSPAFNGPT